MCSAHYGALHNPLYIYKAAAGNSQACVLHMGHDPGIHKRGPMGLHNYTQYPRFRCGGVERSGYGLGIFGAGPMQDR